MLGPDVSASEAAGGVPSTSVAIGGSEGPKAPTSPLPHPALSVRAVLLEPEVEKSMQEDMAALEELPRFGPDSSLEGALP
jgi:hypothetical protein